MDEEEQAPPLAEQNPYARLMRAQTLVGGALQEVTAGQDVFRELSAQNDGDWARGEFSTCNALIGTLVLFNDMVLRMLLMHGANQGYVNLESPEPTEQPNLEVVK